MKKLLFGLRIFLINVDLKIISIFIIGLLIFPQSSYAQQKVVGYYESWFTDYSADKIEYNNLTHIINSFAQPNSDGTINMPYGIPNSYLVTLTHRNNKKLLISFNNETNAFDTVTADTTLRAKFINNVVKFLSTYHYDGIDIDWEFPDAAQGKNLTLLVQQMRKKFQETDTTWLIAMAVPAGWYYGQYYQFEKMVSYVDWFAIMAYDYYGSWTSVTGHNAPLYGESSDDQGDDSSSVVYYTSTRKVSASKLLLGVPFYGKEFSSTKGLYKSYKGDVPEINYADLVDTLSNKEWVYHWDNTSKVPYYTDTSSTRFITLDDTMSIRLKTQFSLNKKLGGVMIWAIGCDMKDGKQPLLETIAKTIGIVSAVADKNENIPSSFYLYNNYPNPFNPSTTISWQMPEGSLVTLKVYDILGNEVASLVNGFQKAGAHSITFNTQNAAGNRNLSSGIYFYRLAAGSFVSTRKMVLVK